MDNTLLNVLSNPDRHKFKHDKPNAVVSNHKKKKSEHVAARLPVSLKCHSGAAWNIQSNTHTL